MEEAGKPSKTDVTYHIPPQLQNPGQRILNKWRNFIRIHLMNSPDNLCFLRDRLLCFHNLYRCTSPQLTWLQIDGSHEWNRDWGTLIRSGIWSVRLLLSQCLQTTSDRDFMNSDSNTWMKFWKITLRTEVGCYNSHLGIVPEFSLHF
jgi:hypothetical protein